MAAQTIKMIIQLRRDTASNWELYKDVIPASGEPCFVTDKNILKIGDGVTTFEKLEAINGVSVSVDGKSLVFEDGALALAGFNDAEEGAQLRKNADGNIEWFVPSTETVEGLQSAVTDLQSDVTNLQTTVVNIQEIVGTSDGSSDTLLSRVDTLEKQMSSTGEGTVDAKIDAKIESFATSLTNDDKVNTLMELINYVETHGEEAANMAGEIRTLQELVGNDPVADQIIAAIAASEEKANIISEHVEYEISHKPNGTLVDYRDKEIRVMVPADTEFELQNSGTNADANAYYIGFKAYAPNGAVSFKEDLAEIITDNTMYTFDGNEFAGIDEYGRKYSIVWLPVANYADGAWTYYGINSNTAKYIGWYYSVEWYDVNGKKIDSDCIRINLSNENCHNAIEPYYMTNVVKEVSVGGTLLDVIGGKVEIPVGAGLKSSDEISIAEDGTLEVKAISFNKITQDEETVIVMDGGGAV